MAGYFTTLSYIMGYGAEVISSGNENYIWFTYRDQKFTVSLKYDYFTVGHVISKGIGKPLPDSWFCWESYTLNTLKDLLDISVDFLQGTPKLNKVHYRLSLDLHAI